MNAYVFDMVRAVFQWVFAATLSCSVFILLLLLLKRVLGNRLAPRWQYVLWLPLLPQLLLPPLVWPAGAAVVQVSGQSTLTEAVSLAQTGLAAVTNSPQAGWNWQNLWLLLWLAGAVVMAGLALRAHSKLHRAVQKQPQVTDEAVLSLLAECKQRMGLQRHVTLLEARGIPAPTAVGIRCPAVLLSRNHVEMLSQEQLQHVLYHELSHLKRHDILFNSVLYACLTLHWFNPLLWYAYYRMRQDQEVACDALALTFVEAKQRISYGRTLLQLLDTSAKHSLPGIADMSRGASIVERRIRMIAGFQQKSHRLSWFGTVMLGVSILFFFAASFLAGCGTSAAGMQRFDQQAIAAELDKAAFQPKLPAQLPFAVKRAEVSFLETQPNVITITFIGENGEQMGLQAVKGKVTYEDDLKRERVKVGSKEGQYVENEAGAQMLNWEDSGVSYDLTYFSKQSGKKISQEDLVATAASCR